MSSLPISNLTDDTVAVPAGVEADAVAIIPVEEVPGADTTSRSDTESTDADAGEDTTPEPQRATARGFFWRGVLTFGVLPALALAVAAGAGYLKWLDGSMRESQAAGVAATRAATDSTIAMLSYQPDTVEEDLVGAQDRLTGQFKDAYTSLTHDVVIPGAKQQHISAAASVPAAASVSSGPDHAVVLIFVNQIVTVGSDPPSSTASTVRVTLDRAGGRWLISAFDPI